MKNMLSKLYQVDIMNMPYIETNICDSNNIVEYFPEILAYNNGFFSEDDNQCLTFNFEC